MEWIDVNVRLPQNNKEVLVIDGNDVIWIMILNENDQWECPQEGWVLYATHWMELPKPPKRK